MTQFKHWPWWQAALFVFSLYGGMGVLIGTILLFTVADPMVKAVVMPVFLAVTKVVLQTLLIAVTVAWVVLNFKRARYIFKQPARKSAMGMSGMILLLASVGEYSLYSGGLLLTGALVLVLAFFLWLLHYAIWRMMGREPDQSIAHG